jgi:hypothetical protein
LPQQVPAFIFHFLFRLNISGTGFKAQSCIIFRLILCFSQEQKVVMKKYIIFPVVLILLSLSGCRKDIELPNEDLNKLFGKWEWVQSVGGISGGTETPASKGYTQTYEFTSKGQHIYYQDDAELFRINYIVEEKTNSITGDQGYLINYYDNNNIQLVSQFITIVNDDELILQDNCLDCFEMTFKRK